MSGILPFMEQIDHDGSCDFSSALAENEDFVAELVEFGALNVRAVVNGEEYLIERSLQSSSVEGMPIDGNVVFRRLVPGRLFNEFVRLYLNAIYDERVRELTVVIRDPDREFEHLYGDRRMT